MSLSSHRRFLRATLIVSAGLLLAACGKKEAPPAPAPAAAAPGSAPAAPAKVYVVGTDAAYAPFEIAERKGRDRRLLSRPDAALAAKAGIEVKFVNTPWEGIFNALAQGDRDLSDLVDRDHRRAQADDGLHRPVLRRARN